MDKHLNLYACECVCGFIDFVRRIFPRKKVPALFQKSSSHRGPVCFFFKKNYILLYFCKASATTLCCNCSPASPPPWLAFIFSLISSPLYRLGGPRPLCWEWFGPYGRKDCVLTRVFWSLGVIFCVQQSLGFCLACQATNVNDPDSKKAGGLEATARRPNARKCATMWILNLVFRVSLASLKFYAFADFALFKKKIKLNKQRRKDVIVTQQNPHIIAVYIFIFLSISHCSYNFPVERCEANSSPPI